MFGGCLVFVSFLGVIFMFDVWLFSLLFFWVCVLCFVLDSLVLLVGCVGVFVGAVFVSFVLGVEQ